MTSPIRTKPVPNCDKCGSMMQLRRGGPKKSWKPFWGCRNYPDCKFTLNIDDEGKPIIDDDDRFDAGVDIWDTASG